MNTRTCLIKYFGIKDFCTAFTGSLYFNYQGRRVRISNHKQHPGGAYDERFGVRGSPADINIVKDIDLEKDVLAQISITEILEVFDGFRICLIVAISLVLSCTNFCSLNFMLLLFPYTWFIIYKYL